MAVPWNPDAPDELGLEWRAVRAAKNALSSTTQGRLQRWRSTAAETIFGNYLYLDDFDYGLLGCEVFAAGNEVPTGLTETLFYPTGNPASNQVDNQAGGTTNLHQAIDESTPLYSDYLNFYAGALPAAVDLTFTITGLTGRRILGVRVELIGKTLNVRNYWRAEARNNAGVELALGGIGHIWPESNLNPPPERTHPYAQGFGGVFWTPAVAVGFDGTVYRLRLSVTGAPTVMRLYRARIRVLHCVENRVAAGIVPQAGFFFPPGWLQCGLWNIDQLNNWAKATNTDYSLLVRPVPHVDFPASAALRRLDGEDLSMGVVLANASGSASVPILESGAVESTVTGLDVDQVHPFAPRLAASGNASVDAQPYTDVTNLLATELPSQELTASATRTYTQLKMVVSDHLKPTQPMLVAVNRLTPTFLLLGQALVPAEAFDDPLVTRELGSGWKEMVIPFDPTPTTGLTAGQQALVSFLGYDPASTAWEFAALTDTGQVQAGASRTFGSTVDTLRRSAVGDDWADMMVTLLTATAPPSGLGVEQVEQHLPNLACDGELATIAFARLTWQEPALGADFYAVEIARHDPFRDRWDLILSVRVAGTLSADDHEAHLGIQQRYKARMVRTDGSRSPWSDEAVITLDSSYRLTFTSNERSELNCAYDDTDDSNNRQPDREYTFLDAGRMTFTEIYDEDYALAEQPDETLGDEFARVLLIKRPPGYVGTNRFDDLRAIARANPRIPYVCVREPGGGRWYAALRVRQGSMRLIDGADAVSLAHVTVREIAGRPEVIEIT